MKKIKYLLILIFIFLFQISIFAQHFPFGASTNLCKSIVSTRYSNAIFLNTIVSNNRKEYGYAVTFAGVPTLLILTFTNNRLFYYSFTIYLPYDLSVADAFINSLEKQYGEYDLFDMKKYEYIDIVWFKEKYILYAYLDFVSEYPDSIAYTLHHFPPNKKLFFKSENHRLEDKK